MNIFDPARIKSKNVITAALVAILLPLSACDGVFDLLDENPPHLMTDEALFQDQAGFEAGLNGLYSRVRDEYHRDSSLIDLFYVGTDGFVSNHSSGGSFSEIAETWGDLLNPAHSNIAQPWEWLYDVINIANNIISHSERDDAPLTAEEQSMYIAEAKAVRAWAYRHLTYLYGDVPLNLEPSSGATIRTDWERAPVTDVRQQMIADLLFAEERLPINATLPGRMTRGAVQHYLSETYLAMDDYDSALFWADQIIDNPEYELITQRYGVASDEPGVAFMDMFRDENVDRENGNTEALWVFQYAHNVTGGEGRGPRMRRKHKSRYHTIEIDGVVPLRTTHQRGGEGRTRFSLTKWAIDLYEPEDDRGSEYALRKYFVLQDEEGNAPHPADRLPPGWEYGDTLHLDWSQDITPETVNRRDWPYSRKWDWASPDSPGMREDPRNILYLRLGETYLLKAEAEYLLGNAGAAAETINILRRRANASEVSAGDINIDFILDERQRELATEEHRRYHLLRTGKWMERTRSHNNNGGDLISEKDRLLPIPQSVIDANETEFPQNPGY